MIKMSNVLIIGGMHRNAGKTTLSEQIVATCAAEGGVTAVKVTIYKGSHARDTAPVILEESGSDRGKDTARLLAAGATRVCWLKSDEPHMPEALDMLMALGEGALLCESNTLRKYVEPGAFILVKRAGDHDSKPSAKEVAHLADLLTETRLGESGEVIYEPLPIPAFRDGKWGLE